VEEPQDTHASNGGAAPLRATTPRRVRLTQLDGKLPNLALMRLAHFHREQGDEIVFERHAPRDLYADPFDIVYGSTIFTRSAPLVDRLRRDFPGAIVGGPGAYPYKAYDPSTFLTVERLIGRSSYEHYDYSIYPNFTASIGYTQRGCRWKCSHCPVPTMEGRVHAVATTNQVWRGHGHPRHLLLLDNDFFGQPNWKALVETFSEQKFRVCLSQGINVRAITPTVAEYIAQIPYYDDDFSTRRLYTAWDNIGDETPFKRGMDLLFRAGVKPDHCMVYMLIGYHEDGEPPETIERIFYRFEQMRQMGVRVFPMPYNERTVMTMGDGETMNLKAFQRWVVSGAHIKVAWSDYRVFSQTQREQLHRLRREAQFQIDLPLENP
jgi:hypothetical protein